MDICISLNEARQLARFARSVRVESRIVKTIDGYAVLYRTS